MELNTALILAYERHIISHLVVLIHDGEYPVHRPCARPIRPCRQSDYLGVLERSIAREQTAVYQLSSTLQIILTCPCASVILPRSTIQHGLHTRCWHLHFCFVCAHTGFCLSQICKAKLHAHKKKTFSKVRVPVKQESRRTTCARCLADSGPKDGCC